MYGFAVWEKQGFLLGITETVQMYRCEVTGAKGTLLLLKVLGKEMLPGGVGRFGKPCPAGHNSSAAATAWDSVPRLTNTAQISCQSNFTASTLVLAHSSALRQQSIVPQRPAQRGSFGTPISALQRDAATPMSRGPGGLGMIRWHDESGARAV